MFPGKLVQAHLPGSWPASTQRLHPSRSAGQCLSLGGGQLGGSYCSPRKWSRTLA